MAGKKSDAESFASRWANKGNENQDRDCTDQGYDQHAENEIGRQVDYIVVPVYLIELSHGILPSPRMAK